MLARFLTLVVLSQLLVSTAAAGNLSTLSTFSARYLSHLNRHATTDLDAGAYNLAGQAFGHQGFSAMLANQTWFRLERLSYRPDADSERTNYDATNGIPAIPSFNLTYNHGDWGIYFMGGVPAGGGATFAEGHPLYPQFEGLALEVAREMAPTMNVPPEAITDVKAQNGGVVVAKAMVIGLTLGTYFKVTDYLSLGWGIRYIDGRYSYEAEGVYDIINEDLGVLLEFPAIVDSVHNAHGFGFMMGMHLQPTEDLNLGFQFQTNTALEYFYDTAQDNTGLFPDGDSIRKDIPPIMAMGASYQLTPDFQIASSWTLYFNRLSDQGRDSEGRKNIRNYRTGFEGGLGLEYRVFDDLLLRTGFLFNRSSHTPEALSSLTWSFDHFVVGAGLTWEALDWLDVTIGASQMMPNGGLSLDESIDFLVRRTAMAIELGIYL